MLAALRDGEFHPISSLQEQMPFGMLELAETIAVLRDNGLVVVSTDQLWPGAARSSR